jgi:hypothetical protein
MTPAQKKIKAAIEKVIFERAYELQEKAEEYRGILFSHDANREEISAAALRQAVKEWHENKAAFNPATI